MEGFPTMSLEKVVGSATSHARPWESFHYQSISQLPIANLWRITSVSPNKSTCLESKIGLLTIA